MDKWTLPIELSDAEIASGACGPKLVPDWEDIPEEFKDEESKWCRLARLVFFGNLENTAYIEPREGVDALKAGRHIQAIMRSNALKHNHKIAASAYLMSLFFKDVIFR